jgi:hypothetical protein
MHSIGKYDYMEDGAVINSDGCYYKAGGFRARIDAAKNENGWAYGYDLNGPSVSITRPIYLNDEDVTDSKEKAIELATSALIKIIDTMNFNNRFDAIRFCITNHELDTNCIHLEKKENKQMSIFDLI